MIAVIYLTLTAKPVSLRRLGLLFVFALLSADFVCTAFGMRQALRDGLAAATAITAFAWSIPLAQIAYGAIRFHSLQPETLQQVSGFILWTYACFLTALPMLLTSIFLGKNHHVDIGVILKAATVAILVGPVVAWLRGRQYRVPARHRVR